MSTTQSVQGVPHPDSHSIATSSTSSTSSTTPTSTPFTTMGSVTNPPPTSTSDPTNTQTQDTRAVFFFDIDNCLYPKTTRVHDAMARLINVYFTTHLSMSSTDATRLHHQYYKDYGLAIEGLSRFHSIDPMDFNREVDDALPLDDLLRPDPEVQRLLSRFDRSKVKMWLFTNAHETHGRRVVKLLQLEEFFEGMTYCDYRVTPLVPKPKPEMFEKAEREAGVVGNTRIYYVDDSGLNCVAAWERGWKNTVHLVEPGSAVPEKRTCKYRIGHLRELVDLFPELIKTDGGGGE